MCEEDAFKASRARKGVIITIACCAALLLFVDLKPEIQASTPKYTFTNPVAKTQPVDGDELEKEARLAESSRLEFRIKRAFKINTEKAEKFSRWIIDASKLHDVPSDILAALIATESSFRLEAQSWYGAVGPTQVVPRYWQNYCGGDLLDPKINISCGAKVLSYYRDRCADWVCALQKYNVGETGYYSAETDGAKVRYITRVMRFLQQFTDQKLLAAN